MVPAHLPMFRSEAQLLLLGNLLLSPETARTANELGSAAGLGPASTHRELQRLVASGVVVRDQTVRPYQYMAATASPLFEPLADLLRVTVGVEERLRSTLENTGGVDAAVIHGSWAEGTARPESDIDVLVVGSVDGSALRRALRRLGEQVGRRIDVTVMPPAELRDRYRRGDGFTLRLMQGPQVPLLGDVREVSGID
jgi:predicted nucleotidyltransferase